MNLLLDTHVFLWILTEPSRVPKSALEKIQKAENKLFLSIASLWEITILKNLGRIETQTSIAELAELSENLLGLETVEITPLHLDRLMELEFHHRDPFDRLIAAQSLSGEFKLISQDKVFDRYGVQRSW